MGAQSPLASARIRVRVPPRGCSTNPAPAKWKAPGSPFRPLVPLSLRRVLHLRVRSWCLAPRPAPAAPSGQSVPFSLSCTTPRPATRKNPLNKICVWLTSFARSTKQKLLLTAADRGGSPVLLWLLCAVRREGTAPNARSALSAGLPFGCPVAPWLKQGRKRKRLLPFGNSLFIFHQKGSSSLLHTSSNDSKPSNCFP